MPKGELKEQLELTTEAFRAFCKSRWAIMAMRSICERFEVSSCCVLPSFSYKNTTETRSEAD